MKKLTCVTVFFLTTFFSLLFLHACGSKDNPDSGGASVNDVQFTVPDKMDIPYGAETIRFHVQFGKKPVAGDQIVLGSLAPCPITDIKDSEFKVNISSLWGGSLVSGKYTVSIRRGSVSQKRGEMQITVGAQEGDVLKPADGATVYGKVRNVNLQLVTSLVICAGGIKAELRIQHHVIGSLVILEGDLAGAEVIS